MKPLLLILLCAVAACGGADGEMMSDEGTAPPTVDRSRLGLDPEPLAPDAGLTPDTQPQGTPDATPDVLAADAKPYVKYTPPANEFPYPSDDIRECGATQPWVLIRPCPRQVGAVEGMAECFAKAASYPVNGKVTPITGCITSDTNRWQCVCSCGDPYNQATILWGGP